MEVTQTVSEGLKREFKVVLPARELVSRLDQQLADMKDKVRINGFRPGKVPTAHLRRVYGRSVMTEIVQNAVGEANKKIAEDNSLRFALEPRVDFPADKDEIESVLEARGDFAFTVSCEILPHIESKTFEDLALERPVAVVPDEEIDATLQRLVAQHRTFTAKPEPHDAAASGDQVTLDFTGTIEGEVFEGGSGAGVELTLGSGSFVPGFEEQLIGTRTGDERVVEVTFPADYSVATMAGKPARFEVVIKAVSAPDAITVDDEFAKGFGAESLDNLKVLIRTNIEGEFVRVSRTKLKRRLLDALDKRYDFPLPESLVEQEFKSIWSQVEAEQTKTGRSFADDGSTEETARSEYKKIAERRVRLGLVLADVGERSKVTVTPEEVRQGVIERVRQFPGQEQMIWDYYQKNPEAMTEIRAPLYEEKVVDYIVDQAKVTDAPVSREELFAPDSDDLPFHPHAIASGAADQEHGNHDHDHGEHDHGEHDHGKQDDHASPQAPGEHGAHAQAEHGTPEHGKPEHEKAAHDPGAPETADHLPVGEPSPHSGA